MPEFRYADETEVKAAQLMTPEMANFVGNVHGGQVLLICDNIGYACASRYAANASVTAAIDRVDFYEPVHVGDLLHVVARVTYVGRTSMELDVDVHSENFTTGVTRHTSRCRFTFVSMSEGKPAPVPRLIPRTHGDKVRYLQSRMLREMSVAYRNDTSGAAARWEDMDESTLDSLIADDHSARR